MKISSPKESPFFMLSPFFLQSLRVVDLTGRICLHFHLSRLLAVLCEFKHTNMFTCLMSMESLDKKTRIKWKTVPHNGWYSSCSFNWMSELMQFTIHYFIWDQINNDNYSKMQRKSATGMKKYRKNSEKYRRRKKRRQTRTKVYIASVVHWLVGIEWEIALGMARFSCEIDEKWKERCTRTVAQSVTKTKPNVHT